MISASFRTNQFKLWSNMLGKMQNQLSFGGLFFHFCYTSWPIWSILSFCLENIRGPLKRRSKLFRTFRKCSFFYSQYTSFNCMQDSFDSTTTSSTRPCCGHRLTLYPSQQTSSPSSSQLLGTFKTKRITSCLSIRGPFTLLPRFSSGSKCSTSCGCSVKLAI